MLRVAIVRTRAKLPRAACAATFGKIAIPMEEVTRASGTCINVNAYDQMVIAPGPLEHSEGDEVCEQELDKEHGANARKERSEEHSAATGR